MADEELKQQVKSLHDLYKKYTNLLLKNFEEENIPIWLKNVAGDNAWLSINLNQYRIETRDNKDSTVSKQNVNKFATSLIKEIDDCLNNKHTFHGSDWYEDEGKALLQEMRKIAATIVTPAPGNKATPSIARW